MRRIRALTLVLALVLTTTVIGAAPAEARGGHQRDRSLPAADVTAIDELLQAALAQGSVGLNVVVDAPGRGRLERASGVADVATGEPLTPRHRHRIASITKTFTATALLRLVDWGLIGLDDPVDRYVEGLPNGDRVTIRHVLNMQSGWVDYAGDPALIDRYATDRLVPGWTVDDALEIIRTRPATFDPGARTVYTNSNYVVAGRILERVTHLPAEWAIALLAAWPAGVDARFPRGVDPPAPYAHGHDASTTDVTPFNPQVYWTAGSLVATAPDVARWVERLVDGSLLSRRLQADRLTTTPLTGGPPEIGYGLGILRLGEWYGHDGQMDGYDVLALHHPSTGTTVVVLANSLPGNATPVALGIAEHLVPGSTPTAAG